MSDAISFLAYAIALLLAVHGAYSGKVVETCKAIGRQLDGATGPSGFQDAITPPETTKGLMMNWALTLALIVVAWSQIDEVALAATVAIRVFGRIIAGAVFNSETWKRRFVRKVFASMVRRQADYVSKRDTERAEAMRDLLDRFGRSPFASQIAS